MTATKRRVKRALERDDGLNTILLDIKQELGIVSADIRNIKEDEVVALETRKAIQVELKVLNGSVTQLCGTVGRLEPIVDTLNLEYQRRVGFSLVFKKAHAVYLAVAGVIGTVATYFVGWPKK